MSADLAQFETSFHEAKEKAKAVNILSSLIPEATQLDPWFLNFLRNEIAYHGGHYFQQYLLGVELRSKGLAMGNFSIGVGASEYGFQLLVSGYLTEAKAFGEISVKAWETYKEPKAKGGHFYSQALALAGLETKAKSTFDAIEVSYLPYYGPWNQRYAERLATIRSFYSQKQKDWPPALVVQKQVEAYNRGDIDQFLSYYHPEAEISFTYNGRPIEIKGHAKLKDVYGKLFSKFPKLEALTPNRQTIDNFVIDKEITYNAVTSPSQVVAIYTVINGLITKVDFLGEPT
ncbi:MAG: nuclear transport factor 2 family protein [Pseudobacteriovorax sp.]|nr:nuclear transport factor 2 family protein [Pseudobacteriovorax sp.]